MELTCQARKLSVAMSVRAVTGRTWRNVGVCDTLLIDLLSRRHEFAGGAAKWLRSEIAKMGGKRRDHRRAQDMSHIEHDIVGAPALGEGAQLIPKYSGCCPASRGIG